MNLGKLTRLLEKHHDNGVRQVSISFFGQERVPDGFYAPTNLDSYRGFYDRLALGYDTSQMCADIEDLIFECKEADGAIFTGWKGGDYTMNLKTPVYADNPGEANGLAISNSKIVHSPNGSFLALETFCLDDYM